MKFTSMFTVALVTAAELANTMPTPNNEEEGIVVTGILDKRAQANAVTGNRKGYTGDYRVYRQEINKFAGDQSGRVANLFLLALERMQGLSKGNPTSYWEISAIHGRPYQGWNGEGATGNPNSGYCTHASTLFPTWHRPYLALYEQTVWNNAQAVVSSIPKTMSSTFKKQWQDALNVMRVPYWDWAQNAQMPNILTQENYPITRPNGAQGTIRNPLYAAYLKSGTYNDQNLFPNDPFFRWSNTKRYPTSSDAGATSQDNLVNQQLAQNGASLKQRVYQILVNPQYKGWTAFSNKGASQNGADSIEAIHDVIHGLTGNGGHMSYIDYSSFDPVFYLHHANIDRLFAIWQAINPHAWVVRQQNGGGTYGVQPGTWEDANTPLTPFRGLNGQFWTSNSVRDTSTFGYGYAETPKWRFKNKEAQYSAWVKGQVSALYGNTNRALASAAKMRKRDAPVDPNNTTAVAIDKSVNNHQYYDWKVDIQANKMALGASYFVHFFIGDPSANPKLWSAQKELVGDYVVFTNLNGVAPWVDPATVNNMVSGSVPLTQALIDAFHGTGLESLNPSDVLPFLKKNLHWRVSLMNDTSFAVSKVADLDIQVYASLVTVPDDDEGGTIFPDFGDYVEYPDIIDSIGKSGGSGPSGLTSTSVASVAAPTSIISTAASVVASATSVFSINTSATSTSASASATASSS